MIRDPTTLLSQSSCMNLENRLYIAPVSEGVSEISIPFKTSGFTFPLETLGEREETIAD